ncbi:hypothetical protein PRBEI_2000952400 [Prionailurus iriomotensis]
MGILGGQGCKQSTILPQLQRIIDYVFQEVVYGNMMRTENEYMNRPLM